METLNFELSGDFIELIKLLKLLGLCDTGGDAKSAVESELVKYNGNIEIQKRKKIRKGDKVEFNNTIINVL